MHASVWNETTHEWSLLPMDEIENRTRRRRQMVEGDIYPQRTIPGDPCDDLCDALLAHSPWEPEWRKDLMREWFKLGWQARG